MPVSFNSPPRNFFLLGSSGEDIITNFFNNVDQSTGTDGLFHPDEIRYNYSDQKYILAGSAEDSNSRGFGWFEKRDYDGTSAPLDWDVRVESTVPGVDTTLRALELDSNDNLIVVGKTGTVPWVAKYSNAGVLDWQSTTNSADVEYTGITSDVNGNYYACGTTTTGDKQAFVEKFDANGTPGWGKSAFMLGRDVELEKIAVNSRGQAVAVGSLEDDNAQKGYIVKLDTATGNVLWDRTLESFEILTAGIDVYKPVICHSVFIDNKDQIYIVGRVFSLSATRGFIIKYSPEGNIIWQKETPDNENFEYYDVKSDGDVEQTIVLGRYSSGSDQYGVLTKYSKNGDIVFRRLLSSSYNTGANFGRTGEGGAVNLDADPSFYYLLFVDDAFSGLNGTPDTYTFGKVSTSGNGFGNFQYDDGNGETIDYDLSTIGDRIGKLSDGSVRNDTSDLTTYPFGANQILFDDLSTQVTNKRRQMEGPDSFEYSGSPAIRPTDFQGLSLLGDTGFETETTGGGIITLGAQTWSNDLTTANPANGFGPDAPATDAFDAGTDTFASTSGTAIGNQLVWSPSQFPAANGPYTLEVLSRESAVNGGWAQRKLIVNGTTVFDPGVDTLPTDYITVSNLTEITEVIVERTGSTGRSRLDTVKVNGTKLIDGQGITLSGSSTTTTKVKDQSGKGNDGVVEGPTHNAAAGYWEFDGVDDRIDLGTTPLLESNADFTIESWVWVDSLTAECSICEIQSSDIVTTTSSSTTTNYTNNTIGWVAPGGACAAGQWKCEVNGNHPNGGLGDRCCAVTTTTTTTTTETNSMILLSAGSTTDGNVGGRFVVRKPTGEDLGVRDSTGFIGSSVNEWHHYVGVFSGGTNSASVKLYVDGEEKLGANVTDAPWPFDINNCSVQQLALSAGDRYFDGRIGEVRFYQKALSAAQVFQNYNATKTKYINEAPDTAPKIGPGIVYDSNLQLNYDFGNRATYDTFANRYDNLNLDPSITSTENKKTAPNPGDLFGQSVAVGNGKIIVGAYLDDDGASQAGAAYIYDLDGNQLDKIIASDPTANDHFGKSVAVGNGKIVIGSINDDDGASGAGAAYIYDLDGNNEFKIIPSNPTANVFFGNSVAVGDDRIVVGNRSDNTPGDSAGSAYIYDLDGNQLDKITASDGVAFDFFGNSVAVGNGKIVVGADSIDSPGAAYIYDLDGNNEVKITDPDGVDFDQFGYSVAVGDDRIVVGAPGDGGDDSGSAFIYDLDGNQLEKIIASDPTANAQFGYSVAVGNGKIVVGAYKDDDNGSESGSAYIYDLDGNQLAKITASDGVSSDQFGKSVAVGDGRIVVGAHLDDDGGSASGSAYIYSLKLPLPTIVKNLQDSSYTNTIPSGVVFNSGVLEHNQAPLIFNPEVSHMGEGLLNGFAWEIWMALDSTPTGDAYIFSADYNNRSTSEGLRINSDRSVSFQRSNNTSSGINVTLSLGDWNHFVVIMEGLQGLTRVYHNGTETLVNAGSSNFNPEQLSSVGSSLFIGKVAEIRVYDRFLTATEVSQNFNATRSKYGV